MPDRTPRPARRARRAAVVVVALLLATAAACSDAEPAPADPGAAWRAALADRAQSPAVWYSIGESLAEGQGASSPDTRWYALVRDRLSAAYPDVGTADYRPVLQRVYGPDSTWGQRYTASTGVLTMRDGSSTAGYGFGDLGHKSAELTPGSTVTFDVTGTAVDLCWVGGPAEAGFSYTVDGGAPVAVSTLTAEVTALNRTRVTFGAAGPHTVTVTADDTTYLSGLTVFDGGETAGLTTVEGGWSSATVQTPYLDSLEQWRVAAEALQPDLVTIELGGNDVTEGTDPAVFRDRARQLVDMLQALPSRPSVYWVYPYQIDPSIDGATNTGQYQEQIEALVAEDPSLGLVSLLDQMPAATMDGTGLYSTDGIHPNDAGQQRIAELVGAVVVPQTASATPS